MEIASDAPNEFSSRTPFRKPDEHASRGSKATDMNPVTPSAIRKRLRRIERWGTGFVWAGDMFIAFLAWHLALAVRVAFPGLPKLIPFMSDTFLPEWLPMALFQLTYSLTLYGYGCYGRGRPFWVLPRLLKAAFFSWLVLLVISYLFKWTHLNRPFLFILAGSLTCLTLTGWLILRTIYAGLARVGLGVKRVLVVGTVRSSAWVLHDIVHAPAAGVRVLGLITDETDPQLPPETSDIRIFKGIEKTARFAAKTHAEEVVLCLPDRSGKKLIEMLQALWPLGVRVYVLSPDLSVYLRRANLPQHAFHGLALLDFGRSPMANASPRRKRVFDLLFGSALLFLSAPFLFAIGLLIWLTEGRPVLYVQERCGSRGRRFKIWKFRTMHVDADLKLADLQAQNEAQGPIFKIRKDPRVTPFGAFLRRHSLDELPQLWNVLRGEMSLVGPRPPLPSEVETYESWHQARLAGVVGCTGLWQVSGRSNLEFDEMAMLDIYYLHNMNCRLDFTILLRTLETILVGQGAY